MSDTVPAPVHAMMSDRLSNVASGLGGERDKMTGARWAITMLDKQQLDAAYAGDGFARKIVDTPAKEMIREWRAWQAEKDQIELIEAEEKRLGIQAKVKKAISKARLYGGAAIVMGFGDEDAWKEISPDRIGRGGLKWCHVMHRYELTASDLRRNPDDPWYGEPRYYQFSDLTGKLWTLHPSRVVRFIGNEPADETMLADGWGDSVLQAVQDALLNAGSAMQGVASLIQEAKVDVFSVPGLMDNLADAAYSARLVERFTLANTIKSLIHGIVLDAEEEYEQKQVSFSNLPELIREYLQILSGVSGIPATKLLGQAPGGLNSDGESAIQNYYDDLRADQTMVIGPAMHRLDEMLIRSATGARDSATHYVWNPLQQQDEKEQAEIEAKRAETFAKIAATGLVPSVILSKALQNAMIESGRYPGIETAIEEFGEQTQGFEGEAGDPNDPDEISAADAAPRTLYVYRKVLNGAEILAWAKEQGFTSTLEQDDLHVTVMYSRKPVDWFKMGESWMGREDGGNLTIPPGGARMMEEFDGGATVLLFASSELAWRHENMRREGASWDYPEYQPHITITYQGSPKDLKSIEPYRGKIELGPEQFEEVNEDWKSGKG